MTITGGSFLAIEALPLLLRPDQFRQLAHALGIHMEVKDMPPEEAGRYLARALPDLVNQTQRRLVAADDRLISEARASRLREAAEAPGAPFPAT